MNVDLSERQLHLINKSINAYMDLVKHPFENEYFELDDLLFELRELEIEEERHEED